MDSKDGKESAALSTAIRSNRNTVAQLLIDGGAPLNPVSVRRWPPLWEAAYWHRIRIMKMLLSAGADPEAKDEHGIGYLPSYGFFDVRVAKTLLVAGANPNARDDRGRTALLGASSDGYEDAVELLVEYGA